MIRMECSMRLDNRLARNASQSLQCVDVLGVMTCQQSFFMQQTYEIMRRRRFERARIQFFSQRKERLRIFTKIVQFEDCRWMWQIVLL